MEALMAGTAILEVFMASVGIATLIAIVVLRGSFALMRGRASAASLSCG